MKIPKTNTCWSLFGPSIAAVPSASHASMSSDETTQFTRTNASSIDRDSDNDELLQATSSKQPGKPARTRRTGIALAALSTILLLTLLAIIIVENKAPHSSLARWLRKTPCKARNSPRLAPSSLSSVQARRKRQSRRLEEADDDHRRFI